MKRRSFLTAALATGSFLRVACEEPIGGGKRYPAYRYRLTVAVETPEGLRTGSSVLKVRTQRGSKYAIPNAGWVSSRAKGEAVTGLGRPGTLRV